MDQFLLGKDILVAPIDPFNNTRTSTVGKPVPAYNRSRLVRIPPGEWTDAFSGTTVTGPQMLTREDVAVDELPLYHRRGGTVITAGGNPSRVGSVDWNDL